MVTYENKQQLVLVKMLDEWASLVLLSFYCIQSCPFSTLNVGITPHLNKVTLVNKVEFSLMENLWLTASYFVDSCAHLGLCLDIQLINCTLIKSIIEKEINCNSLFQKVASLNSWSNEAEKKAESLETLKMIWKGLKEKADKNSVSLFKGVCHGKTQSHFNVSFYLEPCQGAQFIDVYCIVAYIIALEHIQRVATGWSCLCTTAVVAHQQLLYSKWREGGWGTLVKSLFTNRKLPSFRSCIIYHLLVQIQVDATALLLLKITRNYYTAMVSIGITAQRIYKL